jgi:putrescine transport system substrate-binding protein
VVEAKLLSGHTGYDVVFHSYRYAARLIPIGVFQPLDNERLPGRGNLDPWVLESMQAYDPGNRYGVPYMWGSTGFAWNRELVLERLPRAPVDSAAMLFDPAVLARLADCGVTLTDEPTDVIPMVLMYLGHDPNSTDPAQLRAAEQQLAAIRPFIRYFSSSRMINDLPNREVCVAMSWSGDYAQAAARAVEVGADVDLAYTTPAEGSLIWVDGIFIPADAEHRDNAHRFIDYLLRPEVIARITEVVHYANANLPSRAFIAPEVLNDPAVFPPDADRDLLRFGLIFGPGEERQRTRSWSRFKTGL